MINGGLKSSSCRFAGFAALCVLILLGLAGRARSEDLGDSCCADLEERVAALEAMTAREGGSKISVKLFGKINKSVLFWNDGAEKNSYVVDNSYEPSRFGLAGSGKINGNWSVGYVMEMEIVAAPSQVLNQLDDDDARDSRLGLRMRHSYAYVGSDTWGQVRMGLTATPIYNITKDTNVSDLEDTMTSDDKMNRSFFLRPKGTKSESDLSSLLWSDISRCYSSPDAFACSTRRNGVAYWSPAWNGFIASLGYFEDDIWGAALRYQQDWGDKFEVGAGIGYEKITDEGLQTTGGGLDGFRRDIQEYAGSASIKHLPTGIFLFSAFSVSNDNDSNTQHAGIFTGTSDPQMTAWDEQIGIQRKLVAFGVSSFFGGYADIHDGVGAGSGLGHIPSDRLIEAGTFANVGVDTEITGSDVRKWYLGVDQAIDSANMDLYAVFEHLAPDVDLLDKSLDHVPAPLDDVTLFYTGARIFFCRGARAATRHSAPVTRWRGNRMKTPSG